MLRLQIFLFILSMCTGFIASARILGIYPTPSISHQVVFRALTLELVKRGHEVVVLTTDPIYKNEKTPKNLTEIYISNAYGDLEGHLFTDEMLTVIKRGVIMYLPDIVKINPTFLTRMCTDMYKAKEVKDFIADKSQKFDLVIAEALYYNPLIFSKIYDAPAIMFSSLYGTGDNLFSVGAISRHPNYHPNFFRNKIGSSSFWEQIVQYKTEWDLYKFEKNSDEIENDFLKTEFGADSPTVEELKSYVELLFVNVHPIFDGNRPVPPGVVYLGGLHLKPTKPLPKELQSYLDNSSRGAIYVSLGTNVRPSMMDREMLESFLNAFAALPYDIMWKFDGDDLKNVPKNVRIQKWFPQRDLLGHPNMNLFITQGGLQSMDEAIDAELPMVGIPFLGDQWYNVNKYVELGIGEHVDSLTITADKIVAAALKVIGDSSYKKNIARLRSVMRDQPQSPLERAVWWTEYVLRHGRSRRLLPLYANKSYSDWFTADVLMFVGASLIIAALSASLILYKVISFICCMDSKTKIKKA